MPRPTRAKDPIPAWIIRERKRLKLKPQDIADQLSAMGLPVVVGTVRTWEAGRNPHPDNVEGLERIFGTRSPDYMDGAAGGDTLAASSDLLAALANQTAAIDRLIVRLDSLASQAIRDGVLDALREAGLGPDDGASPDEPPPGSQP